MYSGEKRIDTNDYLNIDICSKTKIVENIKSLENNVKFLSLIVETGNYLLTRKDDIQSFSLMDNIRNFFRNSGFYLKAFYNVVINLEDLFEIYTNSFNIRQRNVLYLLPLQGIYFKMTNDIKFDDFEIKKFTHKELAKLIRMDINKVFYPGCFFDLDDVTKYWFICVKDKERLRIDLSGKLLPEYTDYPEKIESILKKIILFDWQAILYPNSLKNLDEINGIVQFDFWAGFEIQFVIKIYESLLFFPQVAPDLSKLILEPVLDANTGEEISYRPVDWMLFNEEDEKRFINFIQYINKVFKEISKVKFDDEFIEKSLSYFVKAFFSKGIDQLLWHIVSIESLIGERGDKTTNKIANRLANTITKKNEKKRKIKQLFRELYNFRSILIHGSKFDRNVYFHHLKIGRIISHRIIMWFINYIYYLKDKLEKDGIKMKKIRRKDILYIIDLNENDRKNIKFYLDNLPNKFPYLFSNTSFFKFI